MDDKGGVAGSQFASVNIQTSAQSLVTLMAETIGVPIGLTTVIDEAKDRQIFIAAVGLPEPVATLRETPLSRSFCRIVKATDAPLIVTNAREDARVRDNPVIDELGVMAYLGYPLRSALGDPLGSVCILDTVPRIWSASEDAYVRSVAEAISTQIGLQSALVTAEETRRQAEAANHALLESNRRFKDLADNIPGAIFRYVEHPDGRTEIEFMSPGCLRLWEVTPEEIYDGAGPIWALTVREDLRAMVQSVRHSAETMTPWNHRWRIKTRSGVVKWLEGYGQPSKVADGSVVWNSFILDVTKGVLAEQKAADAMRLLFEAGKQETIGRLVGGIAHDFNNLLMVIRGNAEALIDPVMDVDRAPLGRSIIKAAELGAELTKRLVSFARKSDLHPSYVDVNELIGNLRSVLCSVLPPNISFEIALADHLPLVVVDKSFLESALLNLAINARDAMAGKGAFTIETTCVDVTETFVQERGETIQPGPYVMVAVSDTGIGMAPEVLARIFEPFFTTKSATKGTGLGLPMVEGFVRQSGGTIRVYSEPGKGTSFCLYLPVPTDMVEEGTPLPDENEAPPIPATVLLVEDKAEVRSALRAMLESDGFTVIEAATGEEGLDSFLRHQDALDIVVSDISMPGLVQGPEMMTQIRHHRADLPVVYVSGYPHEATVHGHGIRRADLTLTKPVSRAALRTALGRALR